MGQKELFQKIFEPMAGLEFIHLKYIPNPGLGYR